MKEQIGEKRWLTKRKMSILVCMVCIIAVCILYSHYISGSIQVDPELIRQDNLDKICLNWGKLTETGLFIEQDSTDPNEHLLQYAHAKFSPAGYDMAFYILIQDHPQISLSETKDRDLHASYERKGIVDAFYGLGRFGECTSRFTVGNSQCLIDAVFYESSGTAAEFEKIMHTILNTVD